MKRKAVVFILLLAFSVLLNLSLNQVKVDVEASNGFSVHNLITGLNYTSIQEAINANETLSGHTIFVEEGIYYENIVLNKSPKLIGANERTTVIDGNKTGTVVDIVVPEVAILNFTIRRSGTFPYSLPDTGLRLINADNCLLANNTIKECFHAIYIVNSSLNSPKKQFYDE